MKTNQTSSNEKKLRDFLAQHFFVSLSEKELDWLDDFIKQQCTSEELQQLCDIYHHKQNSQKQACRETPLYIHMKNGGQLLLIVFFATLLSLIILNYNLFECKITRDYISGITIIFVSTFRYLFRRLGIALLI